MKMETNKVKILTLKETSLPAKSQRLEVGFGLFGIIFTLPKLSRKELALNSTEILQLKLNCTRHCARHFIEHGHAYIKILFMMAQ